jgi:predicted phage terminase large subunit-like protein
MPAPLGGGLVKAAWFKRYAPGEGLAFDRIVQSWDTASKATELSDFSVCTSWGIRGKDLYLLDVLRRRMEYPELKRAVREQYERFRPDVVLIEDKASGTQLIQELIAEGLHSATRYQPQSDKIMRMHAQTAMIENGFVHLPDNAPWLAAYLHELISFPKGRHDDQVDSTAQMLDWFKRGGGPHSGIFEYYRMRALEMRTQQAERERRVRLRVPPRCQPHQHAPSRRRRRWHGRDVAQRGRVIFARGVGQDRRRRAASLRALMAGPRSPNHSDDSAFTSSFVPDLYPQVCIGQSSCLPITADHTESGEEALHRSPACFETRSPSAPQHEVCS